MFSVKTTLTALALCTTATLAWAENHALLVGASTYPNLEERYWLKGPANDVDLVATYLKSNPSVAFSADNITILADGIEGSQPPTLAAIRSAFSDIAAKVTAGDFVYLHFSGHGTQAPAPEGSDELDGLDELFLPVDIGPWQDEIGTVSNALVDDEIGQLIDSIRAKGADVWVVFDSCHSGTATRAAPTGDDVRLRKLAPEALGVPTAALQAAKGKSRALSSATDRAEAPLVSHTGSAEMGSLTAFFAAQTDETTPEKNMPKGKEGRRLQGVFTYTLFETLAERPNLTYRQLGQEVLRKYSVKNLARSTPMFEGNLDGRVFGQGPEARILQWPATKTKDGATIDAGVLHGLTQGAELLLLASPADTDDAALARFQVTSANTFRAVAKPIGDPVDIPKGAVLRKSAGVVDFSMLVALPPEGTEVAQKLADALALITKEQLLSPRVKFVPAGADADIRLGTPDTAPNRDAIYVLPSSGMLEDKDLISTHSISTADKTTVELADVLADSLGRIAKATNLLKIGATAASDHLPLSVELTRAKFDIEMEEIVESSRSLAEAVKVPRLVPNDVIGLRLKNNGDFPVDYNILYVGSDYSVTHMDNGRMLPGAELDDDFVLVTDEAFGKDRLLVILSPATPQSAVQDLSFLEQAPLDRTRSTGTSGFAGLLDEAGFGEITRAAVSLSKRKPKSGPPPMVVQFEVETVPVN